MKKIPFIGWFMLLLATTQAIVLVYVAIISVHHDMGERIMVASCSIGWFLTIVGMCIYARHQERKGEEQLKQSGGK